jgi:hypothetical protein
MLSRNVSPPWYLISLVFIFISSHVSLRAKHTSLSNQRRYIRSAIISTGKQLDKPEILGLFILCYDSKAEIRCQQCLFQLKFLGFRRVRRGLVGDE